MFVTGGPVHNNRSNRPTQHHRAPVERDQRLRKEVKDTSGSSLVAGRHRPRRARLHGRAILAEMQENNSDHICFLVHGLQGAPGDLFYLASVLQRQRVLVHTVECNWGRTTDGIVAGGERVAAEIKQVVAETKSPLRFISLVGFSLGGLYVRSALGTLVDNSEAPTQVAGLEPHAVVFIATPHLGVRGFRWWHLWPRWTHGLAGLFAGLTGRELFLIDASHEPLLLRMARDRAALRALDLFRIRLLVGNLCYDLMVSAGTSLIIPHERRYRVSPASLGGYCVLESPHVRAWTIPDPSVCLSAAKQDTAADAPTHGGVFLVLYLWTRLFMFLVAFVEHQKQWACGRLKRLRSVRVRKQRDRDDAVSFELQMAMALDALTWRRYAVAFDSPWIPAHNRLVAWSRHRLGAWLWRHGRPVVEQIVAFMDLSPCVPSIAPQVELRSPSDELSK
ncbi:hypothetical protein CCYA_CCYA12G3236 [Cyanidiococcus yangmingshanensis]|nr:hypothetical protein CCYA_CCYA12G3236 [Cyanidiococcus yangmingshanensis]